MLITYLISDKKIDIMVDMAWRKEHGLYPYVNSGWSEAHDSSYVTVRADDPEIITLLKLSKNVVSTDEYYQK